MNCIIVDDDPMSRQALKHLVAQISVLKLIKECNDSLEAFNVLSHEKVDLILLDVEMPGMSGLDFLKTLKNPPLTILTTSEKKYALEAYEYNVIDYIVKPVTLERFIKAITKAQDIFGNSHPLIDSSAKDQVFIKNKSTLLKINTNEILWIEALGDYITINTAEKKHVIHSTMKAIENKLSTDKFTRVHRSFIIAIDKIESIDDTIVVINKKLIPVGAVYKENLLNRLNFL
jgi:two-component system LytT family response regulator